MKSTAGVAVLAGVLLITCGTVAGLLLGQPAALPPSAIVASPEESTMVLTKQTITDSRTVQVALSVEPKREVSTPVAGLVTSFRCEVGGTLDSWQSNLSVNGAPVLNLGTAVPLWRDLRVGDTGEDVTAVQTELARLGHPVVARGALTSRTVKLVNARMKELGAAEVDPQTIPRANILWLPAPSVALATCATAVGAQLTEGQSLASLNSAVTRVTAAKLPADLVPGARVLIVDGSRLPLGDSLELTTPEDVAAFAATSTYREHAAANPAGTPGDPGAGTGTGAGSETSSDSSTGAQLGGANLVADIELATPLDAWTISPSALSNVVDGRACVVSSGTAHPVTVVASSLGKSYITFASGTEAPSSVDLRPARNTTC